jgi:hypothetical protein
MHTYLFQPSGEKSIPYFLWGKGHHDGRVPTLFLTPVSSPYLLVKKKTKKYNTGHNKT